MEKLLSNRQRQKKSLMQQLLTGKKRLPEFNEKWNHTCLSRLLKVKGGNAFKSQNFSSTGIPLIRISNIKTDYSVNLNDCVYHVKADKLIDYKVNRGDILFYLSNVEITFSSTRNNEKYSFGHCRVVLTDFNKL